MQSLEKNLLKMENKVLNRQIRYRKSLQMPVLTLHQAGKKTKQQIQKIADYEKNQQCPRIKLDIFQRISLSQVKILQSINARKEFEANKDAQLHIPSQSYNRKKCFKSIGNIVQVKQPRYCRNQDFQNLMMSRLNKNIHKTHLGSNLSLVMQKISTNINQMSERGITKRNYSSLNSCRPISQYKLNFHPKNRTKKHTQACVRHKVMRKNSQRSQITHIAQQNRKEATIKQEEIYGWDTSQKLKQIQDFNGPFEPLIS